MSSKGVIYKLRSGPDIAQLVCLQFIHFVLLLSEPRALQMLGECSAIKSHGLSLSPKSHAAFPYLVHSAPGSLPSDLCDSLNSLLLCPVVFFLFGFVSLC